jgi:hypothetical protein
MTDDVTAQVSWQAPAHFVDELARATWPPTPPPQQISQQAQYDAHRHQIQLWADTLWRQAFVAGATARAAAAPARFVLVEGRG